MLKAMLSRRRQRTCLSKKKERRKENTTTGISSLEETASGMHITGIVSGANREATSVCFDGKSNRPSSLSSFPSNTVLQLGIKIASDIDVSASISIPVVRRAYTRDASSK